MHHRPRLGCETCRLSCLRVEERCQDGEHHAHADDEDAGDGGATRGVCVQGCDALRERGAGKSVVL